MYRWRLDKLGNKGYFLYDDVKMWHCNDKGWTLEYGISILEKLPQDQVSYDINYYGSH